MFEKIQHVLIVLFAIASFNACDRIERMYLMYSLRNDTSVEEDSIFRMRADSSFLPDTFDRRGRLFYLCKVWGFVKYYSENTRPTSSIDVDQILMDAIAQSNRCDNKEAFGSILRNVIASIQTDPISERNPYKNTEEYALVDFRWMNDTVFLDATISEQLRHIFLNHSGKSYFIDYLRSRNIKQINEKEYPDVAPDYPVRLLGLFRYWNVIQYFYSNKYYTDSCWDRVLYEAIPSFETADTEREYRLCIYRLIRRLRDTHSDYDFLTDSIVSGQYRPNFSMLKINGDFFINTFSIPGEEGSFRMGDRIMQINGRDVRQLYDSLRMYVGGGNDRVEQLFVCAAMISDFDSVSTYTIERGGDTLTLVSANRKRTEYSQYRQNEREREVKKDQYEWLNDSVAYLNLKYVTRQNFSHNYNAIQDAKVMILDLRCYPDNMIFFNCISTFVPPTPVFAYIVYPDIRFSGMLRYAKASKKIGKKKGYQGRIMLLVDEWTASFSEHLTMALQANPRTVTIGSSSSGANGDISPSIFPGNVRTIYTCLSIYYPDFAPIQRCGVKIDYFVEPTVEALKQGKDWILEEALRRVEVQDFRRAESVN